MQKSANSSTWQPTLIMLGILLSASFLVFYHLGTESLWGDEFATYQRTTQPTLVDSIVMGEVGSMWPAFHGGLYLFTALAGHSEFALRFPSALAGVIGLAAIYRLGCYVYSSFAGLIAAALMAVSWSQVAYTQEARTYAVQAVFVILSVWLWLRLLRTLEGGGRVRWVALAYCATAVVLIFLHIMDLLIPALEGITALVVFAVRRCRLSTLLAIYGGLALLALLPIRLTLPPLFALKHTWIQPVAGLGPTLGDHLRYAVGNDGFLAAGLVVLGAISLGANGLGRASARPQEARSRLPLPPTWILAGWYCVPFIFFYGFSVVARPIFVERYLLMAQPPVYLLVARAIERLPARLAIRVVGAVAVTGLLLFDLVFANHYYTEFQKPDYKGVYQTIRTSSPAGQRSLIVAGGWTVWIAARYYMMYTAQMPANMVLRIVGTQDDITRDLDKFTPDYMWYVTQPSAQTGNSISQDALDGEYRLLERLSFPPDITLSWYRVGGP